MKVMITFHLHSIRTVLLVYILNQELIQIEKKNHMESIETL